MKRWQSGLAALGMATLWFTWTAKTADRWLFSLRDSAALVASGTGPAARGVGLSLHHSDELAQLHTVSEDWGARAAATLTPDQRRLGLDLSMGFQESPQVPGRLLAVEGDLWGLSYEIIGRHGAQLGPLPDLPTADPWGTVSRRDRVHALVALLRQDALTPDQAASLLSVTVQAMQAQVATEDLEMGRAPPVGR